MILLIGIKNSKPKRIDNSNDIGFVCNNKKGKRFVLLDDLDELSAITSDLKVLTYLKVLTQEDFEGGYISEIFSAQTKVTVDMYLTELQIDKVKKLESVMKKVCL